MEENGVSKINGDDDDDVMKAKMEDIWEVKKMEIGGGKCDYNITLKKEKLTIHPRSLMNKNCIDAKNHIG